MIISVYKYTEKNMRKKQVILHVVPLEMLTLICIFWLIFLPSPVLCKSFLSLSAEWSCPYWYGVPAVLCALSQSDVQQLLLLYHSMQSHTH